MKSLDLFIFSLFLSSVFSLSFNSNGEFTILQITDMHYGRDADLDAKSQELQRKMIELVKPDVVAVTGDAAQRTTGVKAAAGWFERTWKNWTAPMVEANVPYFYTIGNHDDRGDLNRVKIVQLDQTNPLSLRSTSVGIKDTSNFYVPVYSSQDPSKLAANLWVFDSGSKSCEGFEDGYGCIVSDVVDWYNTESHKVREEHGEKVHHLAFFHIPIPEYLELRNNFEIYGTVGERVSCPIVNTGFFDAVKRNGDISAMFVGHDHTNDFGGFYKDVELVYGRKSGYGSYGSLRGVRVIKLKENYDSEGNLYVTREHYVIDESGSIEYTYPLSMLNQEKQESCPSLIETTTPSIEVPSPSESSDETDAEDAEDGEVSSLDAVKLFSYSEKFLGIAMILLLSLLV